MRRLDLRSRLLAGMVLLAIVEAVVALTLISTTRTHLLDQVDTRLAFATSGDRDDLRPGHHDDDDPPSADPGSPPPERLSEYYEGWIAPDGTTVVNFRPNTYGDEIGDPAVDAALAAEVADRGPITVDAVDDSVHYRTLVRSGADGWIITAIPLTEVDQTIEQLTWVVGLSALAIALVLGVVTWWVMRLGITPIKQMTRTAGAIAAGDLSERIEARDDGTEAGDLAMALNLMLQRIEDSFDERSRAEANLRRFVADASHELRTPVATIRGYAELYRSGGLGDREALDDAMRRTEQESVRMARLVDDMLNLAKLDRGPTITRRRVDVAQLVRDAAGDAQVVQPDRPITVDVPEQALVEADEDLVRQMLANTVGNALVHTDPDVAVHIAASVAGEPVEIVVRDEGPGMPAEVAAKITERFFRADPSRTRHRGGSGLGMSIVDSAVRAHGGTIAVESAPGAGTTVRLTLPGALPRPGD